MILTEHPLAVAFSAMAFGQYGLILVLLAKFAREKGEFPSQARNWSEYPAISVLIPVKGVHPSFEENFRSFLAQDYPGVLEVIFGVREENDPVIEVARRIGDGALSKVEVRFAVGQPDQGLNPKNSNLARAFTQARHGWIYCSDADVRVAPDHFRKCMARAQADPKSFVTVMTVNEGGRSLGAKAECIGSNFEAAMYFLTAALKSANDSMNGAAMLFHRDLLQKAGGFESTVDRLTDDLVLGRGLAECGGKGLLLPGVVRERLEKQSFAAFRARFVRWILIAKSFRPELFWVAPLFWVWQWLIAVGIATGSDEIVGLGIAVFAVRMLAAAGTQLALEAPALDLLDLWALIVYDAMAPISWFQCLLQKEVVWAGNRMILSRGGKLRRK